MVVCQNYTLGADAGAHQTPEAVTKPSSQAILLFLKHATFEQEWTAQYVASALGIDQTTAKQIAAELVLIGYAEPIPKNGDTRRYAPSGNFVAGVRSPRLTRKTADGPSRSR